MKTTIPTAGDLMNENVHTVSPELSLMELIDDLLKHKVSNAPVVDAHDKGKRLVGFISEGDALEHLSKEMFYLLPEPEQTVRAFMKQHPIVITAEIGVFSVASLLVNHGYRHVPVVDDSNHLLGIVSRRDVLKTLKTLHDTADKERDFERFRPDLTKVMNHRFIVS